MPRSGPSTSGSTRRRWPDSTRSSPAASPRRRTTPGESGSDLTGDAHAERIRPQLVGEADEERDRVARPGDRHRLGELGLGVLRSGDPGGTDEAGVVERALTGQLVARGFPSRWRREGEPAPETTPTTRAS